METLLTNFFVPPIPGWEQSSDEERYAELARFARVSPAPAGQRIARIVYDHDGYTYTAEVGRTLIGQRRVMRIRNKQKREVIERDSDAAMVLAIFAGTPHLVVTNKGLGARSHWDNPFMATAKEQTYFDS
ncbi:hypothetical protein ABZS29_38490 [Kribbella sp. NPDC005582]|uniref:hypothetical protein n=1 Tax=Kribbella sp. NPDC005582 TaxID=3156893 RepID=UPI0033BB9134